MIKDMAKVCLQGDGLVSGTKTVASAGTAEQISSTTVPIQSVVIKAESDNTGIVYVGDSSVDSGDFPLSAGDAITLNVDDLTKVYLDVSVNGDGAHYIAETDSQIINRNSRRTTY
jgi:hypothetical protein